MFRIIGVCLKGSAINKKVCGLIFAAAVACMVPQIASAQYADQQPKPGLTTNVGNASVGVYGTLIVNVAGADEGIVGADVPLWATPGSGNVTFLDGTTGRVHDLYFTARQSFVGLRVSPATSTSKWKPGAVVEFDFFGTRPVDTLLPQGRVFNQPRLRVANFQLTNGDWKIVAGQDKAIIAPLDPISLSHVAVPLGATAGNLWGWLPQIRVEKTQKLTDKTTALMQFGVLRPEFADARLSDTITVGSSLDNSSPGTRSSMPFYQGRVAVSRPMNGGTATVGAGAHYGREVVSATLSPLDSWAFAFDFRVPVQTRLILRGEGYVGSNLIPFQGGIDQGVASVIGTPPTTTNTFFHKIGDAGGWAELTVRMTTDDKNHFYVGFGTDDPKDANLLPGSTREKNTFYWASYLHKITDSLTVIGEWSNWQFRTTGFTGNVPAIKGNWGRANVFNVSFGYSF
jgi:hypothetical protein